MVLKNIFKKGPERRKFVRHPAEIPIEYEHSGEVSNDSQHTKNVSFGGLCFQTDRPLETGEILTVCFTTINPSYKIRGKVAWRSKNQDSFDIGIEFLDNKDAQLAKIIEEIIQIKNFQKQIFENET
jgi:hypothetical protein